MSIIFEVESKTVQNISSREQVVFDSDGRTGCIGQRYVIKPGQVQTLPVIIADMFLTDRRGFVVSYTPSEIPNIPGEPLTWLANGTGNPLAQKKIKLEKRKDGKYVEVEIDNPMRTPRELKYQMYGGQETVQDENGEGKSSINLAPRIFKIPPFTRVAVSRTYARWLLNRMDGHDEWARTTLFECRPATSYEPSPTWSLNALRAYAECIMHPSILDNEDIFGHEESYYIVRDEVTGEPILTEDGQTVPDERALLEARSVLYSALFFAISDLATSVPSQAAFEAYLREHGIDDVATRKISVAGVKPVVRRGPGRPKGSKNKPKPTQPGEQVEA